MWEPGLPAMQAPRYVSYTEVMLSQASQLPHRPAPTFFTAFRLKGVCALQGATNASAAFRS